eukprot:3804256-Pyramimonas_sp.AAC.1
MLYQQPRHQQQQQQFVGSQQMQPVGAMMLNSQPLGNIQGFPSYPVADWLTTAPVTSLQQSTSLPMFESMPILQTPPMPSFTNQMTMPAQGSHTMNGGQVSRAIFVGAVPPDTTLDDLCHLANSFGALEQVTLIPEKKIAFVNFVSESSAIQMFTVSQQRPFQLKNQEITVRWGKARPLHPEMLAKIQTGATRCLYLANLALECTEETIRQKFKAFGPIVSCILQAPSRPDAQSLIGFLNLAGIKAATAHHQIREGGITEEEATVLDKGPDWLCACWRRLLGQLEAPKGGPSVCPKPPDVRAFLSSVCGVLFFKYLPYLPGRNAGKGWRASALMYHYNPTSTTTSTTTTTTTTTATTAKATPATSVPICGCHHSGANS